MCAEMFAHVVSAHPYTEATHDFSHARGEESILTHLLYHLRESRQDLAGILSDQSGEVFLRYFRRYLNDVFRAQYGKKIEQCRAVPADFLLNHLSCSFVELVNWWIRNGMCRDTLATLRPLAEKRGISLTLSGEKITVTGVRQLLSEMIGNLCDNAVKYNVENGSVTVTLARTAAGTVLTVADTGIGIPYAHQSRVFERFYRVDKSHSKEVGGTGLGLSIVKHAAQYHGARLELASEVGRGTTIRVIFPREEAL